MRVERQNTPDEDVALVASWRGGEISSFEALLRKYQKRMLNIAYRITGDYEDACEVTQDAFVAAFREIDSFRGESRFSTWLTSITLNLSRNRCQRDMATRKNEICSLDSEAMANESAISIAGPSAQPTALELLERSALHEKLLQCIKALSVEFRETIVLRDMQDYSYKEICDILGIREGTVKSRLFRGRDMVKDCLTKGLGAQ